MDIAGKAAHIDRVLGFYFCEPIQEAAEAFPSPEAEIEKWYKLAIVFDRVRTLRRVPEEQWNDLLDLVEDAVAEFNAAVIIGEAPDQEPPLGEGYSISPGFVSSYQSMIWKAINHTFSREPC